MIYNVMKKEEKRGEEKMERKRKKSGRAVRIQGEEKREKERNGK